MIGKTALPARTILLQRWIDDDYLDIWILAQSAGQRVQRKGHRMLLALNHEASHMARFGLCTSGQRFVLRQPFRHPVSLPNRLFIEEQQTVLSEPEITRMDQLMKRSMVRDRNQ